MFVSCVYYSDKTFLHSELSLHSSVGGLSRYNPHLSCP